MLLLTYDYENNKQQELVLWKLTAAAKDLEDIEKLWEMKIIDESTAKGGFLGSTVLRQV